jgi:hypothetical protein
MPHYTILDENKEPTGCFEARNERVVTGMRDMVAQLGGETVLSDKADCPFCKEE